MAPPPATRRWRETLPNGVSYTTLSLVDNGLYSNTSVYLVPPGHYFMMGDNREQFGRQPRLEPSRLCTVREPHRSRGR